MKDNELAAECVVCGGTAHDVPAEEAQDAICVDCGFDALERLAS